MFGDTLIIGESFNKIDVNNRIIIPSFTKVEENDELLIQLTNYNNELCFKLISLQKYLQLIEKIQFIRSNTTCIEEFEKCTKEIEKICEKLDFLVKVDKQRRIVIPVDLLIKLNWQNTTDIQFKGLGESLLVRKK